MWLDLVKAVGTAKDLWLTTVMTLTRERGERREMMCVATNHERPLWVHT